MDNEKQVDITKYPEGLEYLAEKLELPVPIEDPQARKDYVFGLIDLLVRQ